MLSDDPGVHGYCASGHAERPGTLLVPFRKATLRPIQSRIFGYPAALEILFLKTVHIYQLDTHQKPSSLPFGENSQFFVCKKSTPFRGRIGFSS